jgi:hypothetical protein
MLQARSYAHLNRLAMRHHADRLYSADAQSMGSVNVAERQDVEVALVGPAAT